MHWVDRGPEPDGLSAIREQYTPRWVAHYRNGAGNRPTDSRWREFRGELGRVFAMLCAYCEEVNSGEVDHFMPVSRFPDLVYEWSNWVFACPTCNRNKSNKWPPGGYVNPCAKTAPARPERFFTFNTATGELLPMPGISDARRRKAQLMIDDLKLNAFHHLRARTDWLRHVRSQIANPEYRWEDLEWVIDRETPLSSITRALLAERGLITDG